MSIQAERDVIFGSSEGVSELGAIPRLELRVGDFVCLHILRVFEPGAERRLVAKLNALRENRRMVEAVLAEPIAAASGHDQSETISVRLGSYGLQERAAAALVQAVGIAPDQQLSRIPLVGRALVGLAEASNRSTVVVFSTAGLDPLGARSLCAHARKQSTHAFVHLSYSTVSDCDFASFGRCMASSG